MLTPLTQTAIAALNDIDCGDISPRLEQYATFQYSLKDLLSKLQHRHTINKRNAKNY